MSAVGKEVEFQLEQSLCMEEDIHRLTEMQAEEEEGNALEIPDSDEGSNPFIVNGPDFADEITKGCYLHN